MWEVFPFNNLSKKTETNLQKLILLPGMSSELVGGNFEDANPIAASWLLYYSAASIMDSVQDNDPPDDWWRERGSGYALNVASGLYFTAAQILNSLHQRITSMKLIDRIMHDFNEVFLRMCSGQHFDLITTEINLDDYWKLAGMKSGAFFMLASLSGARLGTSDEIILGNIKAYGYHLGIIIQILDDLEDLASLQKTDVQEDLNKFRKSLPFVYGVSVCTEEEKQQLIANLLLANRNIKARLKVFDILEECGTAQYLLTELKRNELLALQSLEMVGGDETSEMLMKEIINKLVNFSM